MKSLSQILLVSALSALTLTANASVQKNERVLVVVSELQTHGPQSLRPLYRVIENLTEDSTDALLGDDYRRIHYLKRSQATARNFRNLLQTLSKDPSIQAIDVILSLHGSNNAVAFFEGSVDMGTLLRQMTMVTPTMNSTQISTMKRKLRLMYNLSCFGRSHNMEFVAMGFDVSVGSRGINANSEFEFPSVLGSWQFRWQLNDAFNLTNNDVAINSADTPVRLSGINADSKKFFLGRSTINIDSDPM